VLEEHKKVGEMGKKLWASISNQKIQKVEHGGWERR